MRVVTTTIRCDHCPRTITVHTVNSEPATLRLPARLGWQIGRRRDRCPDHRTR